MMIQFKQFIAIAIISSAPPVVLAQEQNTALSYFDAYLIQAYSIDQYDVSYSIKYHAEPSASIQLKPTVDSIDLVLHGRQVYDAKAEKLAWIEQIFDLRAELNRRQTNKVFTENVPTFVSVATIADGILRHEYIGLAPAFPERKGDFKKHLAAIAYRPATLVGLWGETARFHVSGVEGDRATFATQFGPARIVRELSNQVQIEFERQYQTVNTDRAVTETDLWHFDIQNLVPLNHLRTHQAEGFPASHVSARNVTHNEVRGVHLPKMVEDSNRVFISEPENDQMYEETRRFEFTWNVVNQDVEVPTPESLKTKPDIRKFLGIENEAP